MTGKDSVIEGITSNFISIITIGFYQYYNDEINVSSLLMGLSLFEGLKHSLNKLSRTYTNFIEMITSLEKIEVFIVLIKLFRNMLIKMT